MVASGTCLYQTACMRVCPMSSLTSWLMADTGGRPCQKLTVTVMTPKSDNGRTNICTSEATVPERAQGHGRHL
jgi:hypothetical protein